MPAAPALDLMTTRISEPASAGALCYSCRMELSALRVETNLGKQVFYLCQNENCKLVGSPTTRYYPAAVTEAKLVQRESAGHSQAGGGEHQ